MAFKDTVGNSRVKKILAKSLQKGRVPNSLCFFGPEGVGKKETALVVAKALNCLQKRDDACETCPSCTAINAGRFPDVMVISPEGEVLKIEQMRLLKQTAYLRPMCGKKRVFIIDRAENMNDEASNSLLKILEEPPLYSHIILLTHNLDMVMPTLKSRCQILTFSPVSLEDIQAILIERGQEKEQSRIVSLLVRGNLRQALSIEWNDVQAKRTRAWQVFLALLNGGRADSLMRSFSTTRTGVKQDLEDLLGILSSFCRDSFLIMERGDDRLLMNPDYAKKISEAIRFFSLEQILKLLAKIEFTFYALQRNLNINLLVNSLAINSLEWDNE